MNKENFDLLEDHLTKTLPELLRPKDLIKLGLFSTVSDLSHAMKRNQTPTFIKVSGKKVVFLRNSLIEWLKEKSLLNNKLD